MLVPKTLSACILSSVFLLGGCQTTQLHNVESSSIPSAEIKLDSTRMMNHLQAFEKIAKDHGGNRAVATQGGLASAQYILDAAKKAGYQVQVLAFENEDKEVGQNIFIEIAGQTNASVILLGAHYDSVKTGPGINDNASGVALLLDLMNQYSVTKTKPKDTLVFAFWDSEEAGIAGSKDYAKKLSPEQLKGIKAYINVDMVGTKNPRAMIFDASKSSIANLKDDYKGIDISESELNDLANRLRAVPTHPQDIILEKQLTSFFEKRGIVVKKDISTPTASDTAGFLGKVPVASIILFGQDEGEFAPCYHQACDTIQHVDPKSLQLVGDAVIHLLNNIQ